MFNKKNNTEMQQSSGAGNGTTIISAGTTLKGDISSKNDLRIDGTIIGNISSTAKIVIGSSGVVEGDLNGNQADVVGKVSGNIKAKELLQLRGDAVVNGNLYAGKLQIEPTATFNGQCHMGANIVDMSNSNEQQAAHK
ncbi:MAG TPA: polymer-forming cytoskeletal protein [Chitinophagaceae bacterium]|nr:polymer-forming cytoskeletal protein [Chitinophagaceae bacterium]HNA91579.1 polymer-forming cytoskeletal protein [Chitinophagaceae bacterium]HNC38745.1 polymer-forming cytoskeletal protein [Chitinophagaceae bacterium]HNJ25791.1 polymer-forming cytoskeletal protein [Chitinophagaceae bacterium]HNJ57201.1 polymer-forming cytoskeletal protein [Chitinophagaceae bacterium]